MKQVFGVGKIHDVSELGRKAGHVTRVREDGSKYHSKHIDEKLSKFNKYELSADPQQALARYREALEGAKQYNTKRQVIVTDIILGASPDFADRNTKEGREKWQNLLEKQVDFFKREHGEENVVSVAYHYDEVAHPHAHVLVVPRHTRVLKSEERRDYISHRHFYGGDRSKTVDTKLYKLHDRLHAEVSKDFGLERGTPQSLARHQDVKKFHAMVNDFNEWKKLKPQQILAHDMYVKQTNEHRVQPVRELTKERDRLQEENKSLTTERDRLLEERDRAQAEVIEVNDLLRNTVTREAKDSLSHWPKKAEPRI